MDKSTNRRLSLAPLTPEQALARAMNTPVPNKAGARKRKKTGRKKG